MKNKIFRHIAVAVLVAAILAGIVDWLIWENTLQARRIDVTRKLSLVLIRMENGMANSFLFLEGIAIFISMHPDITEEHFLTYAALVSKDNFLLKNVAAAPDLIIRYVYPLEGNRAILGKNYRNLARQWPDVQKVVETGGLVAAGPLKLIQGGTGLIGRAPVYTIENGKSHLWGIVSSVIDMDKLYESAGIETSGLSLALRKKENSSEVFYGDSNLFESRSRAVLMPIKIPGSEWEVAAVPKEGWPSKSGYILVIDLILMSIGAGIGYWWGITAQKNRDLTEIRQSLNLSQSISHLGSWAMDVDTRDIWWSDETYRIFGMDRQDTPPTMADIQKLIPEKDWIKVDAAVNQAIRENGTYSIEHRILRKNGETAYVEAKGSVSPDGTSKKFTGTILDITWRKQVENDLKAREEQMRAMARASHDALIMIDATDKVLFWSDMAEKMFGWTSREALGNSMHRLITLPEDRKLAHEGLKSFSKTGTGPVVGSVMEFIAVKKDGTTIPVERSVSAFKLGDAYLAVGSLRDITDRKKKEEQLHLLATTDSLTGLFNRRKFMELAQKEIKTSERYGTPFSVIMFDADKFKGINDTYGHSSGDRVLQNIAETIEFQRREIDFPGRLGGEEFAIGLPHTDLSGASNLAQRLCDAFRAATPTTPEGEVLTYTVSLGVACHPGGSPLSLETLMKQADEALYRAKENGRNRIEVHPVQTDSTF